MKIIHIIPGKANINRMNGVNYVAHHLVQNLNQSGNQAELWGITQSASDEINKNSYISRIFKQSAKSFTLSHDLKKAVESILPDTIIHFHGGFIPVYYAIAKILKRKDIPWVLTPHGTYREHALKRNKVMKKIYFIKYDSFICTYARSVQALTEIEKNDILKISSKLNIVVIPNGVEVMENATRSSPIKPLTFCFMGRFDMQHKGLDILIDGFKKFRIQAKTGQLWLVGEGKDKNKIEKLVHDNDAIHILEPIYQAEKRDLLNKIDVFVHTSRWEGMPISVLEAAAHQKTLLLSHNIGMDKIVKDYQSGFITDSDSPDAVAKVMHDCHKIYLEGKLPDMGKNALYMALYEFGWKKVADLVLTKLYGLAL